MNVFFFIISLLVFICLSIFGVIGGISIASANDSIEIKCLDGSVPCKMIIDFREPMQINMPMRTSAKKPEAQKLTEDKSLDHGTPYAQAKGEYGWIAVIYPEIGNGGITFLYEVRRDRLIPLLTERGGTLGAMKIKKAILTNGERVIKGNPVTVRNILFLDPIMANLSLEGLATKFRTKKAIIVASN